MFSILVPVGFFVGLKLSSVQTNMAKPETITLPTAYWEMERPSCTISNVSDHVKAFYADEVVSVNTNVLVGCYLEYASGPLYNHRDGIVLVTFINVSVTRGFIFSIGIRYMVDNNFVLFLDAPWSNWVETHNVKIIEANTRGLNFIEAYMIAKALDSPCSLRIQANWIFYDQDNIKEHLLEITFEILYYNGTAYRKLVFPACLSMKVDAGNTFESAKTIILGNYTAFLGSGRPSDPVDYYKIQLQKEQLMEIIILPEGGTTDFDLDLYLYNQDGILVGWSNQTGNLAESIRFTVPSTSHYYIVVEWIKGLGLYKLVVQQSTGG